jgi:hypothetical protein
VTKGSFRDGLEPETAADLMWVHMSPDVYLSLVGGRGWTVAAYCQWRTDTLVAALLPPRPRRPEGQGAATGPSSRSQC